jgi:hypothetical protein
MRSAATRLNRSPKQVSAESENPVNSRVKGLELDLHLREFEINQLTQRNNFFMIFQGVLIAGLVQSQGTAAPVITFSMSLLGIATSIFQIGMAGGAKYWQTRYEAATRSSEIAIVLDTLKRRKLAVQTFTHDPSSLHDEEIKKIEEWNQAQTDPEERIGDLSDHIQQVVSKDVNSGKGKRPIRHFLDGWVRMLAISPKWSVSRIPIWIGAALLLFWTVIAAHTVHVPALDFERPTWWNVSLVPLKAEKQ